MRHPLPYAFARASQLLLEDDGHALTLWHHGQPDLSALGEVMRKYALSEPALTLERLDAAALAQRISSAYAKGESSAAAVVSEVESDADLTRMMQELPAVEDLLETEFPQSRSQCLVNWSVQQHRKVTTRTDLKIGSASAAVAQA